MSFLTSLKNMLVPECYREPSVENIYDVYSKQFKLPDCYDKKKMFKIHTNISTALPTKPMHVLFFIYNSDLVRGYYDNDAHFKNDLSNTSYTYINYRFKDKDWMEHTLTAKYNIYTKEVLFEFPENIELILELY